MDDLRLAIASRDFGPIESDGEFVEDIGWSNYLKCYSSFACFPFLFLTISKLNTIILQFLIIYIAYYIIYIFTYFFRIFPLMICVHVNYPYT